MPDNNQSMNWFRFFVHFFCGAALGALAGLGLWAFFLSQASYGWLIVPGLALLIGLMAGLLGDSYWESFRDWNWWNPLNWFR